MDEAREWNRTFGYAKIVWEIENCFCLAYRNAWEISSPEFSINGFLSIKWKFVFKVTQIGDNTVAWIVLERLQSDDTSSVRAYWNLSFPFGNEKINVGKKECVFSSAGCVGIRIKDYSRVQEKLQNISTEKFNVEALFLVTSTEDIAILEKPRHEGLNRLLNDLLLLKNLEYYHDVNVWMGTYSFKSHKAILTTGGQFLRLLFRYNEGSDIVWAWSDKNSAAKIVSYLYTGNLDYILRTPSILIDGAIEYFQVNELQNYYLKDELILGTKSEPREFYYKWEIPDILSRNNERIFSPNFKDRDVDITFRLGLEVPDNFTVTGNVTAFLEVSSFPPQSQELFIQFEVSDFFNMPMNQRKAERWLLDECGTLTFHNYITRESLSSRSPLSLRVLRILCTILIPTDVQSCSILSDRKCLLPFINYEEHYSLVSDRIESLFNVEEYSDFRIRCGDELFYVHKCILSGRSLSFLRTLNDPNTQPILSINDIDGHIMRIVLVYIYSGFLKNYELRDVLQIYRAADRYGLMYLRYQCSAILAENLQLSNVLDRLFLADDHKDLKLKFCSYKYLTQHRREIEINDWDRLRHDVLFKEYRYYAVRYLHDVEYRLGIQMV